MKHTCLDVVFGDYLDWGYGKMWEVSLEPSQDDVSKMIRALVTFTPSPFAITIHIPKEHHS